MPYFIGLGYSENKPLLTKMANISLDNGSTLGIMINSVETISDLKKLFNEFEQEAIKEKE